MVAYGPSFMPLIPAKLLIYQALAVIEYLVAHGSERAVDDIIEHTFQISVRTHRFCIVAHAILYNCTMRLNVLSHSIWFLCW